MYTWVCIRSFAYKASRSDRNLHRDIYKDFASLKTDVAEGDEYTIELPGFFEASVSVENGEKVFSITPKEEMKVLIKADEDKAE